MDVVPALRKSDTTINAYVHPMSQTLTKPPNTPKYVDVKARADCTQITVKKTINQDIQEGFTNLMI